MTTEAVSHGASAPPMRPPVEMIELPSPRQLMCAHFVKMLLLAG